MLVIQLCLTYLFYINIVKGNYKYFSIEEEDDDIISYFEREDMLLAVASDKEIRTVNVKDSSACIQFCENTNNCQSINVVKSSSQYECKLLSTVDGVLQTSTGSFHISKKNMCSGYCKNLGNFELCGQCDCIDLCAKRWPYMCNCSTKAQTFTDCGAVQTANFAKSGIYNIDPDNQGSFKAFCEFKDDGSAWMTMMRRMEPTDNAVFDRSFEEYYLGFGKLYDSFWMGLENIHRVTNAFSNDLQIDIINANQQKVVETYKNFKVSNKASGYSMVLTDNYQVTCNWINEWYADFQNKIYNITNHEVCMTKCLGYPEKTYATYQTKDLWCACGTQHRGFWGVADMCDLKEIRESPRYMFQRWINNQFSECEGIKWWQPSVWCDHQVPTNIAPVIRWQTGDNNKRLTMLLKRKQ